MRKKPRQTKFNRAICAYMLERSRKFSEDKFVLEQEMKRCISVDPKNIFLRKLLKSKKIPFYNREELREEIPQKLRQLRRPNLRPSDIHKMLNNQSFKGIINKLRQAKADNWVEIKPIPEDVS